MPSIYFISKLALHCKVFPEKFKRIHRLCVYDACGHAKNRHRENNDKDEKQKTNEEKTISFIIPYINLTSGHLCIRGAFETTKLFTTRCQFLSHLYIINHSLAHERKTSRLRFLKCRATPFEEEKRNTLTVT